MNAARVNEIRRVILTSCVCTIINGKKKECYQEGDVGDPEYMLGYEKSKLFAERAATHYAKENKQIKLSVMNPGLLLGPTLTRGSSFASGEFLKSIMTGKIESILKIQLPVVDVRDAALAHIQVACTDEQIES
jgi:dihydroflavonol-4-reductase